MHVLIRLFKKKFSRIIRFYMLIEKTMIIVCVFNIFLILVKSISVITVVTVQLVLVYIKPSTD